MFKIITAAHLSSTCSPIREREGDLVNQTHPVYLELSTYMYAYSYTLCLEGRPITLLILSIWVTPFLRFLPESISDTVWLLL